MPKEEANDILILNIVAWDSTEGSKLPRANDDSGKEVKDEGRD